MQRPPVRPSALVLTLLLAATASAQARHTFVVDTAASNFTYSGNITVPLLGSAPLVGVPSNSFKIAGTLDADLVVSPSGAVTSARFVSGGWATTVPALQAVLPNPIPFLAPLATMGVSGLKLEFLSTNTLAQPASFSVGPTGNFSTNLVESFLAGVASATAQGSTTNIPLAGTATPPIPITGSMVTTPAGFRETTPISNGINFNDPASGISGQLSINGTLVANWRPLHSQKPSIPLSGGSSTLLLISTGGVLPNQPYLVLASISGTTPGLPIGPGQTLPLNFDGLTSLSLASANQGPFGNTFAFLDANTKAEASFTLPPGGPPGLAGTTLHFAYVVFDLPVGNVGFISNPEPLLLTN